MTEATEGLIARLSADLRPVRRLSPPAFRAVLWLALAFAILAAEVLGHGLRPDLGQMLASPDFVLETAGGLMTGILAAIATFLVSQPDRPAAWALLPAPGLAFWIASLGAGCYDDFVRFGPDGLSIGESFGCFGIIFMTSLVLAASLLWMVRGGARVRPELCAGLAGLGVSALAASALMLFHELSTSIMVLIWHGGTVVLIAAVSFLAGQGLLVSPQRAK